MRIFFGLIIFISLSITGVGVYLIVEAALTWAQSYFAVAQMIVGGILAFIGIALTLAIVIVTISQKINKRRMRKKGGKQ